MYLVCELCYEQPEDDGDDGAVWPVKIRRRANGSGSCEAVPLARTFVQVSKTRMAWPASDG